MSNHCRTAAVAAIVVIASLLLAKASGAMYMIDLGVYLPPAATTVNPANPDPDHYSIRYLNPEFLPNLRMWFRDPVFNPPGSNFPERLMRLTDSGGIGATTVMNEYSSMSPFNESRTKIALAQDGSVAVYDLTTYQYRLVGALSHSLPRWSRQDENVLYYWPFVDGGLVQLFQYNASTMGIMTVGGPWNFNGHLYDKTYNNAGEDDLCFGGDHLVRLVGWHGRQFIVVFSLSAKAVVAEYDITGFPVNSVEIAPALSLDDRVQDKRDILIVGFNANEEAAPNPFGEMGKGIWAFRFDQDASTASRIVPYQQVNTSLAHHDLGQDRNGSPIVVATNSATRNPVPGCQTGGHGIEKIPLSNPDAIQRSTSTCLLSGIPWSVAEHVTLPDESGWVFVSFEDPSDPNPGDAGWNVFTNELVQVNLNGSREMRRLAHHRSRPSADGYRWQPKVSASRDGRLLAFTSNFGFGQYANGYADVYMVGNIDVRDGSAYTLSVSKQGGGSGLVVSRPSGVYCGQKCSVEFNAGATVTLSAVATNGASFMGWRGACFGVGTCTVSLNKAASVTATFAPRR